ncbi:MAG: helix-turn-helix domain-containing protein [Desulfovibrionaceae bacterium]
MDLKELGDLLKQEREKLRMSIADVSESTRISRRILTIFEQGDADHYPHPVYAKGFIRNYARALGLDPEECARIIEDELGPASAHDPVPHSRDHIIRDPREAARTQLPKGRPIWPALLLAFVLALVLGGLIWYFSFYTPSGGEASEAGPQAGVHAAAQQESPAAPASEAALPGDEMVADETAAASEAPPAAVAEPPEGVAATDGPLTVSASAGEVASGAAGDAAGAAAGAGAERGAAEAGSPPADGLNTLVIKVSGREPCWVGVWIPGDEQIARDFTVQGGGSETYRFSGQRTIRFGRAEAVQLQFNGKPYPLEGKGVVNVTLP